MQAMSSIDSGRWIREFEIVNLVGRVDNNVFKFIRHVKYVMFWGKRSLDFIMLYPKYFVNFVDFNNKKNKTN